MNRSTLKQILYSVLLASIVASVLSLATIHHYEPIRFWIWFAVYFIAQFVGFYLLNITLEYFFISKTLRQSAKDQASAVENAFASQSLTLNCAYCNSINIVPVILTEKNIFQCVSCKQENAVMMNFYSARVTNPLARKVETDLQIEGLPDEEKVTDDTATN